VDRVRRVAAGASRFGKKTPEIIEAIENSFWSTTRPEIPSRG